MAGDETITRHSRLLSTSEWFGALALAAGVTFLTGALPVYGHMVESMTETTTNDGNLFESTDASGGSGCLTPGNGPASVIGYAARTVASGGASFAARYGIAESPSGPGTIVGDRFYERNATARPGHIYATDTAFLTETQYSSPDSGRKGPFGCDNGAKEPLKGCDVGNTSQVDAYQHGTAFLFNGSGSSSVVVGRGGPFQGIGSDRSVSGNGYASFGAGVSIRSGTSSGQISQAVDYHEDVSVAGTRFAFGKRFRYSPD